MMICGGEGAPTRNMDECPRGIFFPTGPSIPVNIIYIYILSRLEQSTSLYRSRYYASFGAENK